MVLRFTKAEPDARADALTCVRNDGSTVTHAMRREGVLPLEAARYVVETTLGWRDGWLAELTTAAAKLPTRHSVQSGVIAEYLQAEQWGGASAPETFSAKVTAACKKCRVEPPTLAGVDILRLRSELREFGAAWRPLPPGGVLEFEL